MSLQPRMFSGRLTCAEQSLQPNQPRHAGLCSTSGCAGALKQAGALDIYCAQVGLPGNINNSWVDECMTFNTNAHHSVSLLCSAANGSPTRQHLGSMHHTQHAHTLPTHDTLPAAAPTHLGCCCCTATRCRRCMCAHWRPAPHCCPASLPSLAVYRK